MCCLLWLKRLHFVIGFAVFVEALDEPFAMAAIHAHRYRLFALRLSGSRDQLQGAIAAHLDAPSQTQRAPRRDPNSYAGKAARTHRDQNASRAALLRQTADHRDEIFGVATSQNAVIMRK